MTLLTKKYICLNHLFLYIKHAPIMFACFTSLFMASRKFQMHGTNHYTNVWPTMVSPSKNLTCPSSFTIKTILWPILLSMLMIYFSTITPSIFYTPSKQHKLRGSLLKIWGTQVTFSVLSFFPFQNAFFFPNDIISRYTSKRKHD